MYNKFYRQQILLLINVSKLNHKCGESGMLLQKKYCKKVYQNPLTVRVKEMLKADLNHAKDQIKEYCNGIVILEPNV
jgi:hypothetical protein